MSFVITVGPQHIVLCTKAVITHRYTYPYIQVSQVSFSYIPPIDNMKWQLYSNSQTFFSTYSLMVFHLPFICPI